MTHIKAKSHLGGVEIKVLLTNNKLPEIPHLKYSEQEIDRLVKAFTQGRCSKESLGDYLKRIGAK